MRRRIISAGVTGDVILWIVAGILIAFALMVLLASVLVAYRITHPQRRKPGPELEGLRHRRVEFPSLDGKKLRGILLEGAPGREMSATGSAPTRRTY